MQSEDNEDYTIDVQQHNDLSDKNSYSDWRHPLSIKYTDVLNYNQDFRSQRRARKSYARHMNTKYTRYERLRRLSSLNDYDQTVDFTRKPQLAFSNFENSAYTNTEFNKREITTIPEEVFHYKRQSKVLSSFKKKKAYREKVASLKVVVGRLNEMCLEKPEVLQNKFPEEIMKLFSGIKI